MCTLSGRRRYLEGINSPVSSISSSAERQAVNTVIQGTAADILKLAMIQIELTVSKVISEARPKILLQIHDELIYEIKVHSAFNQDSERVDESGARLTNDSSTLSADNIADYLKQNPTLTSFINLLRQCMESCPGLEVPLPVNIEVGLDWGNMITVPVVLSPQPSIPKDISTSSTACNQSKIINTSTAVYDLASSSTPVETDDYFIVPVQANGDLSSSVPLESSEQPLWTHRNVPVHPQSFLGSHLTEYVGSQDIKRSNHVSSQSSVVRGFDIKSYTPRNTLNESLERFSPRNQQLTGSSVAKKFRSLD